jgi:hypothetical protein
MRDNLPDSREIAAMNAVKNVGATPVIILHGPRTCERIEPRPAPARAGEVGVPLGPVYLEIGNEEDLGGATQQQYTAGWNQIVPALRAQSPSSYLYGGPVNFQSNPAYIAYFAKNATPRPGFISWHEYVLQHVGL